MLPAKSNFRRIVHLLVFSVLVLSIIILLINWPKHDTLVKQIETSAIQLDSTHPINKKIELLSIKYSNVDNKFREFVITKDPETYKEYQAGVKEIINSLDSLNKYSENEDLLTQVKAGLKQKDSINVVLILLHKQLDTLLNINPEEFAPKSDFVFVPYNTEKVVNSVDIDTLKVDSLTKDKKLFGRIGDAIKNKKNKNLSLEKVYIKVYYNKKSISGNVVDQIANFGDEINRYYKNLFTKLGKQQVSLKERELQLVTANKQILINLDNLFKSYKFIGKEADKNIHKQNIDNTIEAGLQLEKIIKILLTLLILVILLLLLYSYLASKHEKVLQEEKDKSDNHAKIRERLLATMSHEIRTPINSIIGFTSLLEKEQLNSGVQDNVRSISFSSNSLLNIVNSTLDFLKTEKSLMKFIKEPFKPNEEITKTTNSLSVLALKKNIEFILENSIPEIITLEGDVSKLHQIIYNLIGNAIKFTDKGKVVIKAALIPVSENKQRISIAITDSGIGIKQEDIKKIFEPYFQITNDKVSQGTGLGLAICKELIVLQGGNIEVESTIGVGSTFKFFIDYPVVTNQNVKIASDKVVSSITAEKPKTIFVIDDDALQLAWIKKAMSDKGVLIFTFSSAVAALEKLKDVIPNYIFTDINMPEMDGLLFLNEVKRFDAYNHVKIIACTGESDLEIHNSYIKQGFNDVLIKPIKTDELLKVINLK